MPYRIEDFDGPDESLQSRLQGAGVRTTRHLLMRWENPAHRSQLLKLVDGGAPALLRLVGLSDLLRVKGVGEVYATLLWEAGIQGAAALGRADPVETLAALQAAKTRLGVVRRLPSAEDLAIWIADARELPPLEAGP